MRGLGVWPLRFRLFQTYRITRTYSGAARGFNGAATHPRPSPDLSPQEAGRGDFPSFSMMRSTSSRGGAPNLQAFSPSISKSSPFRSKFFQRFLWRFWGISRGCKYRGGALGFSKYLRRADCRRQEANLAPLETGRSLTVTRILIFRKENRIRVRAGP